MDQINEIQHTFNTTENHFGIRRNQNLPAPIFPFVRFERSTESNLPSRSPFSYVDLGTQASVIGGILLAGIMFKKIGRNSMIAAGTIFGGYYLYEYLSWKTKAKEQSVNNHHIEDTMSNSQLSPGLISASYGQQVQQEHSTTFAQSDQLSDEFAIHPIEEMNNVDSELNRLTNSETSMIFKNDDVDMLNEELTQMFTFLIDRIHLLLIKRVLNCRFTV